METTNAVTLERMEGVIRWINGQDTQMQESEVRTAINDLIKSFRITACVIKKVVTKRCIEG